MQQWEYLELVDDGQGLIASDGQTGMTDTINAKQQPGRSFMSIAPLCNRLGAEGWEAVGMLPTSGGAGRMRLLFKRPLAGSA